MKMKYKLKFTGYSPNGLIPIFKEDETVDSESLNVKGLNVFIPFTDTRFFEPVKTRKFVVEVDETDLLSFNWFNDRQSWTVTEITENKYLEALKANRDISPLVIEVLSQDENAQQAYHRFIESLYKHGETSKLYVVNDMRDFLKENFSQIAGLKTAKHIVDSFWNL